MSQTGFSTDALKLMAAKGLTLEDIIEIGEAMGVKRSSAAIRQARYRAKHNKRDVTCDVTRSPNEDTSNPPPTETKVSSGGKRDKPKSNFVLPSIVPAELWERFEEMRRSKKKPLNDFARKQLGGRLETIAAAGWNIDDVMTKAIVGLHDGFWMPDGRDSNIRRANEPRAGPVDMDEYRERLARIGKAEA